MHTYVLEIVFFIAIMGLPFRHICMPVLKLFVNFLYNVSKIIHLTCGNGSDETEMLILLFLMSIPTVM